MTWIKTIIILIVVLYLLAGLFLYLFQERLIFQPDVLPEDYEYWFDAEFDELNLEMDDGAVLNALHFKINEPKGMIVYFHGNAGDLSRWGEIAIPFTQYGYEVLIVDYRGYGKSTGDRTQKAMLKDAENVYAHATTLWDQDKIVVYGRSLGGAFATHVAAEFSPRLLILETPFYSVTDVAKSFGWMYPVKSMIRFNLSNGKTIQKVQCPIQIIHGTDDIIVPIKSGRKLHSLVPNAQFHTIEDGEHNNLAGFKEYWEVMEDLLK